MAHHDYATALKIAVLAECDPRTALKALENGIDTIKGSALCARLARAFDELGIVSEE